MGSLNIVEDEPDFNYDDTISFMRAILDADLKWGECKTFPCPLCQGEIIASRSDYNGHHHAQCTKCKTSLHV